MIIEELNIIKKHPKIFTSPSFSNLDITEKSSLYEKLYKELNKFLFSAYFY